MNKREIARVLEGLLVDTYSIAPMRGNKVTFVVMTNALGVKVIKEVKLEPMSPEQIATAEATAVIEAKAEADAEAAKKAKAAPSEGVSE